MHSFGRIGCFFAGCCYGIKYQGPFSITFLDSIAGPNHVALFPIQLLESFINVLVSIFLIFYSKKDRLPGKIFGIYLMLYSLIRFFLEFLRGDIIRGKLFGITTSQWISLLLFPIGYYCYKLGRKVSS
jgi:phosphatidylglycerol:prolipoprotein diacylglycerol transferase